MASPVPLIRAAALAPALIWMRGRGLRWESRLFDAGLPTTLLDEPERPVALHAGIRFFAAAAETEGPDLGCRVVTDTSIAQLASFGRVVLGARTPREALGRLMRAYPHHSSHEQFVVRSGHDGLTVRHWFVTEINDAALHVCHQYVAALIRVLNAGCGQSGPRLSTVRLIPHPQAGLDHLQGHLGVAPSPATDRTLTLTLADAVIDRPYLRPTRDRGPLPLSPIRGDGTLPASLRAILPGIIDERPARLPEIALLAGTSARTLQRRLASESTSLSEIVDTLRRERAMSRLTHGHAPIALISANWATATSRASAGRFGAGPTRRRAISGRPLRPWTAVDELRVLPGCPKWRARLEMPRHTHLKGVRRCPTIPSSPTACCPWGWPGCPRRRRSPRPS